MTPLEQLVSLWAIYGVGILVGCCLDTSECLTRYLKGKVIFIIVVQFIYWMGLSFGLFIFMIWLNNGHVHIYYIVAILIGYLTYNRLMRERFVLFINQCMALLIRWLVNISRCINIVIVTPFLVLFRVLVLSLNGVKQVFKFLITAAVRLLICRFVKNAYNDLVAEAGFYSRMKNIIIRKKKKQ
ncbi:Spore cortex protein YabQ (Spore_YabQ) [Pelagirhabdus alkalitolerans]|uniref:Spore cortex protein YabQ (Spore_YabQ) n=1 Tax=Pelagirhabdus alkalitolerans TaxID=1612202 RepID=A0A1G6MIA2_9BACI|nr:Spore cortex protein YabQ (Spore_YabQ) [Pelagirhabdus alkalitolerans]